MVKIWPKLKRCSTTYLLLFLCTFLLLTGVVFGSSQSYARYNSSSSGDVNVNIANWFFRVNNQEKTFTISLNETTNNEPFYYLPEGKIAPGALGSFDLNISALGSDVATKYNFKLNIPAGEAADYFPEKLVFYQLLPGGDQKNIILGQTYNGELGINVQTTEKIYWYWEYVDFDESIYQDKNFELEITINAEQKV